MPRRGSLGKLQEQVAVRSPVSALVWLNLIFGGGRFWWPGRDEVSEPARTDGLRREPGDRDRKKGCCHKGSGRQRRLRHCNSVFIPNFVVHCIIFIRTDQIREQPVAKARIRVRGKGKVLLSYIFSDDYLSSLQNPCFVEQSCRRKFL